MIEVARLEACQLFQPVDVGEVHASLPEREKAVIAQMAQHPVHVNGAEPERVGKVILRQRTRKAGPVAHADKQQTRARREQEMRHAFLGREAADLDQVLDHRRLVARRGPENGGRQARRLREGLEDIGSADLGRLDARRRLDAVTGGAEKYAAQPHEIARDLHIHDLPLAIRQDLVRKRPVLREDEGGGVRLPLAYHRVARQKGPAAAVKPRQGVEVDIRGGAEGREFSGQGAVEGQHSIFHRKGEAVDETTGISGERSAKNCCGSARAAGLRL